MESSRTIRVTTTTHQVKSRAIKPRVSTQMEGQEISIIPQEKWCVTWPSNRTTRISTETKVSSIRSNKNTKLNCASITSKIKSARSPSTASSLMVKKIWDSQMILCLKISARLLSAQSIQITRRLPANSGRRPVNASSEKAAPSITAKMREDASSIPYPTCQKALPSHQCRRNSRNRDTIMGTRTTITTITTAIIPLIIPATILSPITHPTSM